MVHVQVVFLLLCTSIALSPAQPLYGYHTDQETCGEIYLTVSAVTSHVELNWKFICNNHPNEIRLYDGDPENISTRILGAKTIYSKLGTYRTSILFNDNLPSEWKKTADSNPISRGPKCLKYWIATVRDGLVVQKSCLQIHPTWMESNGNTIDDIPLSKMCIPGTHNSGCYENKSFDTVNKFIITQNKDVYTQLVYGIRYLDVRVGYYKGPSPPDQFFVNHDIFKVMRLVYLLREIKQFLNKTSKEIVILDIHRFPTGFNTNDRERHELLINLLYSEVGDIAIPRSYQTSNGPTLRELWRQKRRLIICYGRLLPSSIDSSWLWSPLMQKWGNQQTVEGLKDYLQDLKIEPKKSNPLWAQMAELTPTASSVFFGFLDKDQSLGHLADEVNSNLTVWYRDEFTLEPNIIATDFFLGNNIIDICIQKNVRKTYRNPNNYDTDLTTDS